MLDREVSGETDSRFTLYTELLGKINARAKSAAVITSRLSAHLQPLQRTTLRLVEKTGIQIVDALGHADPSTKTSAFVALCQIVKSLAPEHHPESQLWRALNEKHPSATIVLTLLGFDPRHATCRGCETKRPEYFSYLDAHYYCKACATSMDTAKLYRLSRTSDESMIK